MVEILKIDMSSNKVELLERGGADHPSLNSPTFLGPKVLSMYTFESVTNGSRRTLLTT